jgi:hypothetical protein
MPGHTLDEAMTVVMKFSAEQGERYEKLNIAYQKQLKDDVKMIEAFQKEIARMQRDLNHGVPLQNGSPKS